MKKILSIALAATVLWLAGCDGSTTRPPIPDVPPPPPPPSGVVQVMHASPDSPTLDIVFDRVFVPQPGSALVGMDYKGGSPKTSIDAATYDVEVDANLADGTTTLALDIGDTVIAEDVLYSIVVIGDYGVDGDGLDSVVLEQPATVTAGMARYRILHASLFGGDVDVYVTAPDADLTLEVPSLLAFGEDLPAAEVAPGDIQVRLTTVGDPAAVLFDSGTISLAETNDLLIVAIEKTGFGIAATEFSLAMMDGVDTSEILDVDTGTYVRFVNTSLFNGTVDVLADAVEWFVDVAYGTATAFTHVDPATVDLAVTPPDLPLEPIVELAGDDAVALAADGGYTIIALDSPEILDEDDTTTETMTLLVSNGDRRRVATEGKVRLVHASPTAGDVDVYLTAPGAVLADEDAEVVGATFQDDSGFGAVEPGDYELCITTTETTDVLVCELFTVLGHGVYTILVIDLDPGPGVELMTIDDNPATPTGASL